MELGDGLIRPEIMQFAVPISLLNCHPDNARRGDLNEIKSSLRAHGQYKPVMVQTSTGHILLGNHTYQALLELGSPLVAAINLDVDDEQAKRILAVDNRTSDLASYDHQALADLLDGLIAETEQGLAGTGFTHESLDDLHKLLEPPDLDKLARDLGEPDETDNWPTVKIKCGRHVAAAWRSHLSAFGDRESEAFATLLGVDTDEDPAGDGSDWDLS